MGITLKASDDHIVTRPWTDHASGSFHNKLEAPRSWLAVWRLFQVGLGDQNKHLEAQHSLYQEAKDAA